MSYHLNVCSGHTENYYRHNDLQWFWIELFKEKETARKNTFAVGVGLVHIK